MDIIILTIALALYLSARAIYEEGWFEEKEPSLPIKVLKSISQYNITGVSRKYWTDAQQEEQNLKIMEQLEWYSAYRAGKGK